MNLKAAVVMYCQNAMASRPTASQLVRGLSDRQSVVPADEQPALAPSCRQNIWVLMHW